MDFRQEIVRTLQKETGLKDIVVEIPPNPELGDFAFPCFTLAKKLKKNPAQIAQDLAQKIKSNKIIAKVEVKGAYLNFFVNKENLAEKVLREIIKNKDYGRSN